MDGRGEGQIPGNVHDRGWVCVEMECVYDTTCMMRSHGRWKLRRQVPSPKEACRLEGRGKGGHGALAQGGEHDLYDT
jgi:hypothetical protein